ncbi:MAG: thiamine pyrophosphate-dependent enzyme, partial [Fidelibacterota bacterium]
KILNALNQSLVDQGLKPSEVVLVTDIGCVGLSDKYFITHAFHGLHGRSITYGSGIKTQNPDLHVVVLIGDGGCGIGGHHLLNAARMNTNVTVLVFNNFNFGMTGGQHSVSTPLNSITATTPLGSMDAPMDIAGTAMINGGGFIARTTAFDKGLPDLITRAMGHDGFALLDIWELCTAYYVVRNDFGRKEMEAVIHSQNMEIGILQETNRPSLQTNYAQLRQKAAKLKRLQGKPVEPRFSSKLKRPLQIVLAGAAGQKVVTAGNMLATGATLSGLWTTRRADFPITIQTGFSIAELIISPGPIHYSGVIQPDIVVLLAPEGRAKIARLLKNLNYDSIVYYVEGLEEFDSRAKKVPLDFPTEAQKLIRKNLSSLAAGWLVKEREIYPFEALIEAVKLSQKPKIAEINLGVLNSL